MALEIDAALREGFERTFARAGLILIAVFVGFGFANAVISQSLSAQVFTLLEQSFDQSFQQEPNPFGPEAQTPTPFAVPLPLSVLALLSLASVLVAEAIHIVSIRVFASDQTDAIRRELATRRIGLATINGVVGGIIAGVLTLLGLVFLIVPGIYIALSLLFVRQEIAVADKNFVDALADSWGLTEGSRWELLGLGIIVVIVNFIAGSPAMLFGFLDYTVGAVLSTVISGVTTVFAIAVITRAYEQLRQERDAKLGVDDDPGDTDTGTDGNWGSI